MQLNTFGAVKVGAGASASGFSGGSDAALSMTNLASSPAFSPSVTIATGDTFTFSVTWTPTSPTNTLTWTVKRGSASASFSRVVDLMSALAASPSQGDGSAWLGFSAACGGSKQETWITNIQFLPRCDFSSTSTYAVSETWTAFTRSAYTYACQIPCNTGPTTLACDMTTGAPSGTLPSCPVTLLDNTGSLTATAPYFQTANSQGGGNARLNSTTKYGYTFTLGSNAQYRLSRLDIALNSQLSSNPSAVDFLVEVWTASSRTALAGTPLYSVHALGTAAANNAASFTSLVLPSSFNLAGGGTYAVTFSPQATASFLMYGFSSPTAAADVTLLGDVLWSGGSWRSPGSGSSYGAFRLVDATALEFTGYETWLDQQRSYSLCTVASGNCALGDLTLLGTGYAIFGITVPNEGVTMQYGLSNVSFGVCALTGSGWTSGQVGYGPCISCCSSFPYVPRVRLYVQVTAIVSLHAANVSSGLVSPVSSAIASTSSSVGAIASDSGVVVTINLVPTTWALTFTPSAPYYFISIRFSGPSTGSALLCPTFNGAGIQVSIREGTHSRGLS